MTFTASTVSLESAIERELFAASAARRLLGEAPRHGPGSFGPKLRNIREVQEAFANQKPGYVGGRVSGFNGQYISCALGSDGTSLWSYGWYELARWIPGLGASFSRADICIRRIGKSYSRTTTRHMQGIRANTWNASSESLPGDGAMQL